MSLKKEFFSNNFSTFITENSDFFKKYQNKFVKIFTDYSLKLSSSKYKAETADIKTLYENMFISPFFFKNSFDHYEIFKIIYNMNDYNINTTSFLNKIFLIMSNNYIKHILQEKNALNRLKTLTMLLDFYIKYIEHYDVTEKTEISVIPEEILEIIQNGGHLNLFTIYKGIPIAHKTNILDIDEKEGIIKVTANNYQIVAAKFHKEIFLLENDKEYSFRANIRHFVVYKKIMYLNNIEKIQRNAPKRSFIRVQPKEKIQVDLKSGDIKLNTELYDISLKGLCVLGEKSSLKVSDIVTVEFILKVDKPHLFTAQGEIKSVTKLDSETFRYHIHFELNTHYEYILSKYITQREKEIIKELNAYISNEFIALKE